MRFHHAWDLVDVAAAVATAEGKQVLALALIVNSGGDRRQAERLGHADSGAAHPERHRVAAQRSYPCAVELKAPDRSSGQAVKRPQSAPHFVHYHLYAESPQVLEFGRIAGDEGLLCAPPLQAICRHRA